ncbi:DEAD/DEAH box helicase, partial [bacterium]
LYNLDPTAKEIAVLDTLGTQRKRLPGQERAGLLPAQRHAAAAMARSIRRHGVGNMQGEMGVGKSTVGAAVIELLDAYPALILCPPHLVPKWIREIEEVIPGAYARELRRIGRNSDEIAEVNDVREFLDQFKQASETAKRTGGAKPKWVAVVAHTSAKFGAGWQPAVAYKRTRDPLTDKIVDACACPNCGQVVLDGKDGLAVPITDASEMAEKRQFCHNRVPGWELDPDGRTKLDGNGDPVWGLRPCGTPLFTFNGARRYSIAEYIAKHAQGDFKLLVADEAHQFKSKSSDRGVAFHQLVTAAKQTLTLTGTFFGGKSTSIFWLLHRLNHGVRHDFAFHDEKRWARLYGVLETTRRRRRGDDADEDGVYTGNRRYRNQAKEQPGVSPAIVSRLLDTTIFLSLKDLNLALPAYKEEVVALDMLDDQGQQYRSMDSGLKQLAVQSSRYLSIWLQWSLARPNSAFRDEVVVVDEVDGEDGKSVRKVPLMELPAINPNGHKWLPKEHWLADFCKLEKQQGRKVLIYVRQTGTRDIQDRVMMPLQANGLRVSILSSNVDPRKREEWIAKRVNTLDAMICNPRLVETGLDLVQFSSVVFFEIEYSLYTLWQSVRRVWRLGQTQ